MQMRIEEKMVRRRGNKLIGCMYEKMRKKNEGETGRYGKEIE